MSVCCIIIICFPPAPGPAARDEGEDQHGGQVHQEVCRGERRPDTEEVQPLRERDEGPNRGMEASHSNVHCGHTLTVMVLNCRLTSCSVFLN